MFSDTLLTHLERYPEMQLQDCVKLCYQYEFGPSHMMKDSGKALKLLQTEMASCKPNDDPLYLPIGNGLCRLSLPACRERNITPEQVFQLFSQTAITVKGDKRNFYHSLHEIQKLAEEDLLPYDMGEVDYYIMQYEEKRCPMLNHSDIYRRLYNPAYRVVWQKRLKDFLKSLR